jgi:hypothetical protein
MKPLLKKTLQWALGMVLLSVTPQNLPAFFFTEAESQSDEPNQYVYEEKDAETQKKRYMVKLAQDKRKCDLAIDNTKTLIGRSKNRPYLPELYLRLGRALHRKVTAGLFFTQKPIQ